MSKNGREGLFIPVLNQTTWNTVDLAIFVGPYVDPTKGKQIPGTPFALCHRTDILLPVFEQAWS